MEKLEVLNSVFNNLQSNNLFSKYNDLYSINLMEDMELKKRLEKFSWGLLYIYVKSFNSPISKKDILAAANIEMVCLSSKILDDVLDEDSPINEIMSQKNLMLLSTDLLVDSMSKLSSIPNFSNSSKYIQEALYGEWKDFNSSALDPNISEEIYFQSIIKKTTSVFKFICNLADSENREFWNEFSDSLGAVWQITNDISAVFIGSKNDVREHKATLPLIKALDIANEKKISELKNKLTSKYFCHEEVKNLIVDTGAIEYCLFISELEKEKCIELLSKKFSQQKCLIEDLLKHLRLVK